MTSAGLTKHLLLNDFRLIRRDQTLALLLGLGVVMAVAMRYLLPFLDTELAARGVLPNGSLDTRLSDVFPMLVLFFGFFNGTQLSGVIFGFLLLEEKDQRTLSAMEVSPISLDHYALCRLLLPAALGFVNCVAMVLIMNQALISVWQIVLLALFMSPNSPIIALFLAACAQNKVQGFAVSKFTGIAGWTVLFGWFVHAPWQWLLGVYPPFLVCKAYWMALGGEPLWWLVGLVGFVMQIGLVAWLAHRFQESRCREAGC